MGSEEERVKQEVVSKPKISEEDKGLQSMATTVEDGVRQDMVATAVRFLENDRVRASTDDMKRKFLLKKGLNEGEIREAFARVQPAVQQPAPQQAVTAPLQVGGGHPAIAVSQNSFSSRIRDLLNLLLLIGGASYGLRYLWKTYIAPWLFGPSKPVPNPQAAVVETCQAVLGGVQQLQQAITSLQTSINSQAEKLERAVESRQGRHETTGDIGELKAEIQSVKGLLLSSRSFPQQPPVSAPPSLPAWQLQQNEPTAPDLLAAAPKETSPDASSSANASSATSSASASSASEIEMISPDSGQDLSGEEGQ